MNPDGLGEFGLIDTIKSSYRVPAGMTGIGDDCAILPQHDGIETLISSDMLVEGSHFLIDDISPEDLGWKSAAVNLSDIAAMGGRPTASFLSFSVPSRLRGEWTALFLRGYKEISDKYGVPLLGGDTNSSPDRLCICVTVLGECVSGTARKRSEAREGDLVCVTGKLGDSAGGLNLILGDGANDSDERFLIRRHHHPLPRIDEGRALAANAGVHAMMDISDGIASDIHHILDASSKGAEIDVCKVPVSEELRRVCALHGWNEVELAVSGGEDYELLFTVSAGAESALAVPHTIIGKITAGPGLTWIGGDTDYKGFTHF